MSKLVKTVTASNFGRLVAFAAASRAARITAVPLDACNVSSRTRGSRTATETALATVLGMS
jgi:hypothetical protein